VDWGWHWGRWTPAPAGRVYVEPYYERVGGRVVYVRGYWGPPNAPRRSYGGERIRFATPVRPANYHRGEHVVVEHRAGPVPGHRPGGMYEHATGTVRPIPHETMPQHRTALTHEAAGPRREGHEDERHHGPEPHENMRGHEGPPGHEGHEGPPGHEAHEGHEGPPGHDAHEGHEGPPGHEGHEGPPGHEMRHEAPAAHGPPPQTRKPAPAPQHKKE
jgi:hypothetical protein